MSVSFPLLRSYASVVRSSQLPQAAPPPEAPIVLPPALPPSIAGPDFIRFDVPLQPETVCKILCKYLAKGKSPEEIAYFLMQNRAFIFSVQEIPLRELRAAAKKFQAPELPETIRQLYLFALSTTELITTIRTYENNYRNERDRLFEISKPGHWSLLAGAHCKTWKQVAALFREAIAQPQKKDRELLIENANRFRRWMTDLKELERALSLDRDNLIFLSRNCYCDNEGGYPMFPKCRWNFPPIFRQLDRCRNEFPCQELLVAIGRRFQQCQELLNSIQPPKAEETALDRFYFSNDRSIYQAALELLSKLAKTSGVEERLTEEFLYGYCDECFGMDLNEWMHLIIAALPTKDLLPLSKSIYTVDLPERGRFLCDALVRKLDLPKDLVSFKKRFEFHKGETS